MEKNHTVPTDLHQPFVTTPVVNYMELRNHGDMSNRYAPGRDVPQQYSKTSLPSLYHFQQQNQTPTVKQILEKN